MTQLIIIRAFKKQINKELKIINNKGKFISREKNRIELYNKN